MPQIDFDFDDVSFNRRNALYLAHASDVAYCRAPVSPARQRLGLTAHAFCNPLTRTRGFLGVCDDYAVLSFRGSDPLTLQTWLTDAVVRLVERAEYDGHVHLGFSSVLKQTWRKIEDILELARSKPLFLTGHSMGGALAVLTACRLTRAGRPPAAVYTFGAPRVGDAAFCAGYGVPTWRLVNRLDLIPEVPLASLARMLPQRPRITNERVLGKLKELAGRVPCYGHVNTLVYIDHDGEIVPDAEIEPWPAHALARAIVTRGKSFHEGITDHLISNYIRALEGRAKSSTRTRRRARIR